MCIVHNSTCHFPYIPSSLLLSTQHLQSIKTVGGSHLNLTEEVITSLATSNNSFRASLKSVKDCYVRLCHVTFSQPESGCISPWPHSRLHEIFSWAETNWYMVHVILYRLFSEGGNYCPEEVEVYSKKMVSWKLSVYPSCVSRNLISIFTAWELPLLDLQPMFNFRTFLQSL